MNDLLAEYEAELTKVNEKLGATATWNIALLKDRELIPETATWISLVAGSAGQIQMWWSDAEHPAPDDWVRVE